MDGPAPTTNTSEAMDLTDPDLIVARAPPTHCPITRLPLVTPWINSKCEHTYEVSSVREHLRQYFELNGEGSLHSQVECPVLGCDKVSMQTLTERELLLKHD